MHRLAGGAAWTLGSLTINRGCALLSTIIVAHLLPVPEFSRYLVYMSLSLLLIPLVDGGMWPVVMRRASRDSESSMLHYSAQALRARTPIWLAAIGILLAVSGLDPVLAVPLFMAIIGAIGQSQLDIMSLELTARDRPREGGLLRIASGLATLAATGLLLIIPATAVSALGVFAVSRAAPAALGSLRARRSLRKAEFSLREGIPFAITNTVLLGYVNSDIILLGLFGESAAILGAYGIAYRLYSALFIIPTSISTALFPKAARGTPTESRSAIRAAAGVSIAFMAVLVSLLLLFFPMILRQFGPAYEPYAEATAPLLLLLVPLASVPIYLTSFQATHSEGLVARLVGVVATVNILGNVALIPPLGVQGALLATTAAELILAFSTLALATTRHNWTDPSDRLAISALLVPIALGILGVPLAVVSASLGLWLAAAFAFDCWALRSSVLILIGGLRRSVVPQAPQDGQL